MKGKNVYDQVIVPFDCHSIANRTSNKGMRGPFGIVRSFNLSDRSEGSLGLTPSTFREY